MLAPLAVNVTGDKTHTVGAEGETLITGRLNVVTVMVVLETQLLILVPESEYTVVALGVNAAVFETIVPFHVYVFAPKAKRLIVLDKHTVGLAGEIVNEGRGKTPADTVLLLIHPAKLVAKTV